ncbi:MAG: NACHT domain-containing protein, partial [Delftia sp.]|nr:NACHT domain-containing protein [Delftia sp.]
PLGRQEPPALDVAQALAKHRRLAVLGGPGAGKTTLLAYLTLTYARNKAGERLGLDEKRLPILVPLRRLRDALEGEDGVSTLPAYLSAYYAALGMRPGEDFFEKALRGGRCLVLLDGLDEVADEDERRRVSEWVDGLVAVYPDNRYVVTSRPPGYESAPLEHGFTMLRVRDFTDVEIRRFADNWCLAVELAAQGEDNPTARRRAREAAGDLTAAIEANDDIRALAVNPLLLSIIALVHRYRATLPQRRVDLYAECVDVLLGHWDAAKGLAGELSSGQTRAVLQPLALALYRENRSEVSRRELEARIAESLPAVGGSAGDAADFVDEVRERSGLLVEAGLGTYAFS